MSLKSKLKTFIDRIPVVRTIAHYLWNLLKKIKHKLIKSNNSVTSTNKPYNTINMSIEAFETKKEFERILKGEL